MIRHAGVVLATMCLVGCSTTRWVYERPGVTPAKLDRDMTLCRREAHDPQAVALPGSARIDRAIFNRCMERKGYTVRTTDPD